MRTTFLFLALLSGVCVSAQNYQTVYSDRTAIFSDRYGYHYYGMKMDSVKIQENDSIFYPLKRIGETEMWCFTPYKASWLGEKIVISGNWNIFINNNDSVWIKTNAKTDDSWACSSNQDYTIEAKVTAHELSSFLGVEDSVKTIIFQAIDKENASIDHLWNNKIVQISKNYGIIRGFDFTMLEEIDYHSSLYYPLEYELAGLDKPTIGIQNFTWKEVWDFEPGDVIHVLQYCDWDFGETITKEIITYLKREEEENRTAYNLSVRKNEYRRMFVNGIWEESTTYSDYETTKYIYKNEMFDKLPGEVWGEVWEKDNYYASTNMMFFSNNGFFSNSGFLSKANNEYGAIYKGGEEQCWNEAVIDGFPISYYIKGLGGPYYVKGLYLCACDRTLVYYKKGGIEWGTPLELITGINEVKAKTPQVVYSKATNSFLIDFDLPTSFCSFELIDLKGQILIREKITSSPHSISIENLQKGLYIYRLVETEGAIYSGKIVK
jgi:hypothetical protein